MDGWDHGRSRATASPLLPSVGCMKKKPEPPSRPHLSTRLLSATARRRRHATGEAEASRARDSVPRPWRPSSVGCRPPAVAPPPGRPCPPVRLCCAASGEPPPQLLLAGSLPDLPAPDARRSPAPLCGSLLLLPGWWLAPSPNSQRYAKLFPPKFLTLTSEIGDELVD